MVSDIFEEFLFGFLKFHDEFLAAFADAVEVENGLAVDFGGAEMFCFLKSQLFDGLFAPFEQFVNKIYEQNGIVFIVIAALFSFKVSLSEKRFT